MYTRPRVTVIPMKCELEFIYEKNERNDLFIRMDGLDGLLAEGVGWRLIDLIGMMDDG